MQKSALEDGRDGPAASRRSSFGQQATLLGTLSHVGFEVRRAWRAAYRVVQDPFHMEPSSKAIQVPFYMELSPVKNIYKVSLAQFK